MKINVDVPATWTHHQNRFTKNTNEFIEYNVERINYMGTVGYQGVVRYRLDTYNNELRTYKQTRITTYLKAIEFVEDTSKKLISHMSDNQNRSIHDFF